MNIETPSYLTEPADQKYAVIFDLQRPLYEPNNGATSWYAIIGLGTPAQPNLRFMIDTGTKNTWMTSTVCTTTACAPHRKYNPALSSTYQKAGGPLTIDFGAWGSMIILPTYDVIALPDLNNALSFKFDMATQYNGSQFTELIADGGIGIPSHMPRGPNSTELLNVLAENKVILRAIASFWYDKRSQKGQVIFGAVDPRKFKGSTVNIVPLIDFPSDLECWLINLDSMDGLFPNGTNQNMLKNVAFALDTGSSQFKGDPNYIDACKKVITNNGQYPETITAPAKISDYPYPTLQLTINGKLYFLPPEKYFIQSSPTEYDLAFHFLADCENEFLVGTTFLESLYTVFDYDNRWIIIAEPVF